MGIITRFKDIMTANFNALLDKCEDPEKMIDQYLRNLESDLGRVKAETASVMAEEKAAKRRLDDTQDEFNRMGDYAKKAVIAGNDKDAKQFLGRRSEMGEKLAVLQQNYDLACQNSAKMRQMHDKLEADMKSLRSRRDMLRAKIKVAETQKKMNEMASGYSSAGNHIAAFDRMEDKVNKMMDEADAVAELNRPVESDSIEELAGKYDEAGKDNSLDEELEALKAQMGVQQ